MKVFLLTTGFLFLSYFSCIATSAKTPTQSDFLESVSDTLTTNAEGTAPNQSVLENLISYAKNYLGVPYRSGGRSGKGFDCSGFTSYIFSRFGFNLPRSSHAQATIGKTVRTTEMRKGDLIFFKGRNRRSRMIGHVGIVVSTDGKKVKFIHASCNRGISIETTESAYYRQRFVKSVRLINNPLSVSDLCEDDLCQADSDQSAEGAFKGD